MLQGMTRHGKKQTVNTKIKGFYGPFTTNGSTEKIVAVSQPHGHLDYSLQDFSLSVRSEDIVQPPGANPEHIDSFGIPNHETETGILDVLMEQSIQE
jgi:hypothetical protein